MADNKKRPAKVEKFLKPIFDPDDPGGQIVHRHC